MCIDESYLIFHKPVSTTSRRSKMYVCYATVMLIFCLLWVSVAKEGVAWIEYWALLKVCQSIVWSRHEWWAIIWEWVSEHWARLALLHWSNGTHRMIKQASFSFTVWPFTSNNLSLFPNTLAVESPDRQRVETLFDLCFLFHNNCNEH